ncbi:hypothetical protein, partial [Xanthomonas phaseoli]
PRSSSKQCLQHGSFRYRVAGKKRSAKAGLFLCLRVDGVQAWRGNAVADAERDQRKQGACATHNAVLGG